MKTWKHFTVVAVLAILAVVFTFIACDDGNNDPPEITREFNDLTFLGKTITLIDRTNGSTDLKDRGFFTQIQNALNGSKLGNNPEHKIVIKFNQINDFAIVVESGENYPDGYSTNGYEVLFRENQLPGFSSEDILTCIEIAIEFDMPDPNQCK